MDLGAEHQQDAPPSLLTALLVHGVVVGVFRVVCAYL